MAHFDVSKIYETQKKNTLNFGTAIWQPCLAKIGRSGPALCKYVYKFWTLVSYPDVSYGLTIYCEGPQIIIKS